jgi:hypothetical protein
VLHLLALACIAVIASTTVLAEPVLTLPIVFHVASEQGDAVVDDAFIRAQLERANAIYAPYGVSFAERGQAPLPAGHSQIELRADRDALGAYARKDVINCYLVSELRDVDDPTQVRRGVHWHAPKGTPDHFVIVAAIAGPNVLAHELGHFLGNRDHSPTAGNLMSYLATPGMPTLDDAQLARMRRRIARYLSTREVIPIAPASASRAPVPAR